MSPAKTPVSHFYIYICLCVCICVNVRCLHVRTTVTVTSTFQVDLATPPPKRTLYTTLTSHTNIHIHASPSHPPSPLVESEECGSVKVTGYLDWLSSPNSLSISRLQFHCCGCPCSLACCLISDPHTSPWRPPLSVTPAAPPPNKHTHTHNS